MIVGHHQISGHGCYIDGAVWANCPAMVGLTEAVAFLGQDPRNIRLLSISTTSYPFHISRKKRGGGIFSWNSTLIETFMLGQAQGAVAQARCHLGGGLLHRIDYDAPPHLYSLDNAGLAEELIRIGRGVGQMKQHLEDVVRPQFLNGVKAAPFHPCPPP